MNPTAHTYRVTHVDAQQRRRRLHMPAAMRSAAEALAVALWGTPLYMAAVRLAPAPATPQQGGAA